MARLPRLTLTGYPHHIIQRGNNRQPIFVGATDRERLLDILCENAKSFNVAVHGYVLMDNHFHLLATPQADNGLPHMMQAVGRSYVRYFNDSQKRTGTLWEGRYKATLMQSERYLLACMVYIDLNPVRARLVGQAQDYPWSSHAHYIGLRTDKLITPHALFWSLGNTPFAREASYAEMVQAGIGTVQHRSLTDATLRGWALGDVDFVAELQKQTTRRLVKASAGRPPMPQEKM